MEKSNYIHCPNCGAPVTTEICEYCHSFTELDSENAEMKYTIIKCIEARLNKLSSALTCAFSFTFMTGVIIITFGMDLITFLFIIIFGILGVVGFVSAFKMILRYLQVKFLGKVIDAKVYGYIDDKIEGFNYHTKNVKLLIDTKDGPKFILYELEDTKRTYKVNSIVKVKMYKNIFLLLDNVKY